jgi:hypothetical protein
MSRIETQIAMLRQAYGAKDPIWCVHYGCESFFDVNDRPLIISCISVRELASRSELTFSMTDREDDAELNMLRAFYSFLRENSDASIVHWNMNRADYGFLAMANRARFLDANLDVFEISTNRTFDLDDLLGETFGRRFAEHPKLKSLGTLNEFSFRYFLDGKEEGKKAKEGKHGEIKRSIEEKTRLIAFLCERYLKSEIRVLGGRQRVDFAGTTLEVVAVIVEIGARMLFVQRQLLVRHNNRPTIKVEDEYDAQDLCHALLRLFFDDVREETWAPDYAGGSSRIDFLIHEPRVAIELKHGRDGLTAKKLGEELLIDIKKYERHPDVGHLVVLVFDQHGFISNPRGLERDLTNLAGTLPVTVRIFTR